MTCGMSCYGYYMLHSGSRTLLPVKSLPPSNGTHLLVRLGFCCNSAHAHDRQLVDLCVCQFALNETLLQAGLYHMPPVVTGHLGKHTAIH